MSSAPILVCGEALVDVFPAGDTPQGCTLDARIGGSPFNVAVTLARLAQPVAFLGGISRDPLGERLMRALEAEGVGTGAVVRTDAPTPLMIVGRRDDGSASYTFHGHGTAERQVTEAAFDQLPADLQAIHVGSYAMLVSPMAATLRALVERAAGQVRIAWDPNVRLQVVPDPQAWRDLHAWMRPRVDILKMSEEDLAVLHPGVTPREYLTDHRPPDAKLVVVTRGAAGAIAFADGKVFEARSYAARVVDTVGAGDAFQGALLAALAGHGDLRRDRFIAWHRMEQVITWASNVAAVTCGRRGADPPRRSELRSGLDGA